MRYPVLACLVLPVMALAQTDTPSHPCPTLNRATFTPAVADQQPTRAVTTLPASTDKVFFYTDVHGGTGQVLRHHWQHNGADEETVELAVGSNRWRTWSSKNLQDLEPQAGDTWTVTISSNDGNCNLGSWSLALEDDDA